MKLKERLKNLRNKFRDLLKGLNDYIKSTDLIGISNITLLSFLFVFFTILTLETISVYKTNNKIGKTKLIVVYKKGSNRKINKDKIEIPEKINLEKNKNINCKNKDKVYNRYGDVVVDGKNSIDSIKQNENLVGNLYVQNIYNYTLPCDVSIKGNLFLRNLGRLKFCGKFTITGNIYITENVSFGNFPKGSKLEGNIIF